MSPILRKLILLSIKLYPVSGHRVFVVQNSDDFKYLHQVFKSKQNFHLELIAGSGFPNPKNILDLFDIEGITLGYVGRIRKDKGVLDLLRTVSELQKLNKKININVWGELDDGGRHGFSQAELDELKDYKRFLRGFSDNKVEIFSSFNWFCLPSNGEGLSKAAIEASSFGLPLVLSNVQGNRDMIEGNGYLFEYGNRDSLKGILNKILDLSFEEYELMSKTSRKMFETKWTMDSVYNKWDVTLKKYENCWNIVP